MKALLLQDKGLWKEMKVTDGAAVPAPGPGEVLVEVYAVGLNPVDYKTGTGGHPSWTYPHILGLDGAGVIAEVGEGTQGWAKGDRVVYHGDLTQKGSYAEYAVVSALILSRIPDEVSFEDAAALPTAGYTAYQSLFRKLPMEELETVFIHGGAGGVGGFAVQLAKLAGKKVFSTASSHNFDYVKSLGADAVLDYRDEQLQEKVLELTDGRGVDAVIDAVSRQSATDSIGMLSFLGHLVFIAGPPEFTAERAVSHAMSFHRIMLGAAHTSGTDAHRKDLGVMGDAMLALLAEGKLSSMLKEVISLMEVPEALTRLADRHVKGKIVARIK